ncbi:MAG: sulfotransferase [Erythrobacter sp.]
MTAPVRPHPLARSRAADRADRALAKAWDKGWLPVPPLDAATLWNEAVRSFGGNARAGETGGRSPADVADFRERLDRLTKALEGEAALNSLGRAMAHGQLKRMIVNRLRFGALWADEPDLARTRIAPPIIVVGHMRSGTTRIHKLLAADPAHSFTRYCDAYHPLPDRFGIDRAMSALEIAALGALNPWLQTIHPMRAGEVEEELAWTAAALHHSIYESQWHIPSYSAWSEAADPAPIYREFDRILRTDAATRGLAERPRVLKVPAFTEDLATLLTQFPDARLVVSQRDPGAVRRSAVSLVANQMAIQSDACDLGWIEEEWRRKLTLREARMDAALADWDGPIARLNFSALNEDWEREIERAYRELGLFLTPEARRRMQRVMRRGADGDHAAHSHQLDRFAAQEQLS